MDMNEIDQQLERIEMQLRRAIASRPKSARGPFVIEIIEARTALTNLRAEIEVQRRNAIPPMPQ
jgi:hypothetical protein